MATLDDAIKAAYATRVTDALTHSSAFLEAIAQAERDRRAALTPEQRRIEDLEREVRELKYRLRTAIDVLNGDHFCE